jgi:serine/threonine protein kinase
MHAAHTYSTATTGDRLTLCHTHIETLLPEETVARYTRQILLGLRYLHANGIAHRDVKGANVLVSAQGESAGRWMVV